ncbi:uncharacterized protein [Mytilus edulis]|uniref:uncharacterized protein isoform X1 n=2 Tax=Mytilus edulis TaxID=6550 RepID=UPI0039EFD283
MLHDLVNAFFRMLRMIFFKLYSNMTDNSKVKCGPCEYKSKLERARKWCTECEEGYCNECVKDHKLHKILRDHRVISIDDYFKIAHISKIYQRCNTHGENFEYFSPSKDKIFCFKCLSTQFTYRNQDDIITIKEALINSSNTTDYVSNFETQLDELIKKVEQRVKCHEDIADYIDDKVDQIIWKIREIRKKIDKKLDKLEARAIEGLKHNAHVQSTGENHHILKERVKEAREIKRNIALTKEYASDKNLFIFSRRVLEPIEQIKKIVNPLIRVEQPNDLLFIISPELISLMNAKSFGEVRPDYRPQVEYCTKDLKTEPGETGPMIRTIEKIKDIHFDCGRKKNLKITCCRILPDKRFVVSVLDNLRLTVHKEDGSLEKSLILQEGSVFGITVIDIQRIAVSHGNRTIDVISLIDGKKKSSFDIDRHCEVYDLVFNNHKLFFGSSSVYTNEILISTMSGKIMGCIPVPKHQSPSTFQMAQLGDKIYFTCKGKTCEKVVCCDLTGDTLWKFGSRKDSSKSPRRHQSGINVRFCTDDKDSLKLPDEQLSESVSTFHTYEDDYDSYFPGEDLLRRASRVRVYDKDSLTASLAIDKYGNVIVTDKSDGVQAVSCDGKVGKVIRKEPTTMIDYDMNLNMLVLLNGYKATLYKIIY